MQGGKHWEQEGPATAESAVPGQTTKEVTKGVKKRFRRLSATALMFEDGLADDGGTVPQQTQVNASDPSTVSSAPADLPSHRQAAAEPALETSKALVLEPSGTDPTTSADDPPTAASSMDGVVSATVPDPTPLPDADSDAVVEDILGASHQDESTILLDVDRTAHVASEPAPEPELEPTAAVVVTAARKTFQSGVTQVKNSLDVNLLAGGTANRGNMLMSGGRNNRRAPWVVPLPSVYKVKTEEERKHAGARFACQVLKRSTFT